MCTGKQLHKVRYYLGSGHCQDLSGQIPGELGVTMQECSILEVQNLEACDPQ